MGNRSCNYVITAEQLKPYISLPVKPTHCKCGCAFKPSASLYGHLRTHAENDGMNYYGSRCPRCEEMALWVDRQTTVDYWKRINEEIVFLSQMPTTGLKLFIPDEIGLSACFEGEWKCNQLGEFEDDIRIHYRPANDDEFNNGFEFFVSEWTEGSIEDNGECVHEIIGTGVALFDGLRHVYFPYLHYPKTRHMVWMWQELRKLEELYCESDDI